MFTCSANTCVELFHIAKRELFSRWMLVPSPLKFQAAPSLLCSCELDFSNIVQ